MSDAIESGTDSMGNFRSLFASRGEPGWHGLGTVFGKDEKVTTAQMLEKAGLAGWALVKVRVGSDLAADDRHAEAQYAVMRINPFDGKADIIGWVGERYKITSNEDLFTFGDQILSGGRWETAGSLKGGSVVFGSLAINGRAGTITLDPKGRKDKIANYLVVASSHNGTMPLTALNTPVRVVCQNTLNMAIRGAKQNFRIKHTTNNDGKVQAAREALSINVGYMDGFTMAAEKMIQTDLTNDQFFKIVKDLLPKPAEGSKAADTRYANKVDLLEAVYHGTSDGPDTNSKIAGTVWGGVNAVTEVMDWYRAPRKGESETTLAALSGFDANANKARQRVWDAFSALVKV